MTVLGRFGIVKADLFVSVNDTTNASVATGRLLANEDGESRMHVANLAADHAFGKRVRTKDKVVVDSFPPGNDLRKKTIACIKQIFTKKAKARAILYKSRNAMANNKTIRIGLDNDTRIAGTELMFQRCLRSLFTMNMYLNQESATVSNKFALTQADWELMAGFDAVMRPICRLSFETQTDDSPSAGNSWLNIVKCKLDTSATRLLVVDVAFPDDDDAKWDASTSYFALPTNMITVTDLPADVQLLQKRFLKELDFYFESPTKHQLLAMVCDPVTFSTGLPLLRALGYNDIVDEALYLFKQALAQEALRSCEQPQPVPALSVSSVDSEVDNPILAAQLAIAAAHTQTSFDSTTMTYEKVAADAYDLWTKQMFGWHAYLTAKMVQMSPEDAQKAVHNDSFYLAKNVDILDWWREHAGLHHLVARVAARELAIPDANGLQERVFSFCKLIDAPRRQNLGNDKFEMCILAFNKDLIMSFEQTESTLSLEYLIESLQRRPLRRPDRVFRSRC